jgi:hypothetical protein
MDLINILDGFIKAAQGKQPTQDSTDFKNWKQCVVLAKLGWKAEYKKDTQSDNVTIMWRKEGKPDLNIILSFTEQCLWLEYLEQQKKENK